MARTKKVTAMGRIEATSVASETMMLWMRILIVIVFNVITLSMGICTETDYRQSFWILQRRTHGDCCMMAGG